MGICRPCRLKCIALPKSRKELTTVFCVMWGLIGEKGSHRTFRLEAASLLPACGLWKVMPLDRQPGAQGNLDFPTDHVSRAQSFPPNHFQIMTNGLNRYVHPIHKFHTFYYILNVFSESLLAWKCFILYVYLRYSIILGTGIQQNDLIFDRTVKWSPQ